jgi:CheY-like chemotaxis protein
MDDNAPSDTPDTVLVVEGDVMARLGLAEYLRHCGYRVIEAASGAEAITLLSATPNIDIAVVLSAVELDERMDGFSLARWVRASRPGVEVALAGSIVKAAKKAGDLCEEGTHLRKPYEPEQVVEWIKKLANLKSPKA